DVVIVVAEAVGRGHAGQGQVLDVGRQLEIVGGKDGIRALAGRLDHDVVAIVDRILVVAGQADHLVVGGRARDGVVAGGTRDRRHATNSPLLGPPKRGARVESP